MLIRVTVGVEAHTHEYIATAHEDQKFGISLAAGAAAEAVRRALARPELELRGLHAHIGSQIFDTGGFEVAARRLLGLHAQVVREHGLALPELDLGGGFGIAYTSEHDPLPPAALAGSLAEIVGQECRALGVAVPRVCVEPGRAIAGPSTFTLYRAGTIKDVLLEHGMVRRYVAVDGGMSDNIRTAAVRRGLLLHAGLARVTGRAGADPGGRQALRERRHRGQGRVHALRPGPRATCWPCRAPAPTAGAWPASTTTCRGRRSSRSATGRPGRSSAARPRTTCSRSMWSRRTGPSGAG